MKLPRWLMLTLSGMIGLTVLATAILLWLSRPGPDLSGTWDGPGWGLVELERSGDGAFEGTYSSTFRKDIGRVRLVWCPRARRYEGTWSEGTFRFGTVQLCRGSDGNFHGTYSADPNCEFQPGNLSDEPFQWSRHEQALTQTVRSFR